MKFSRLFCPTLKEVPSDAEVVSHQLMIRSGMIRKVSAGIYSLLPLGQKVIQKFANIVREEMNRSGAQEVLMPMVVPGSMWETSGRWQEYGPELLRIKDRHQTDYCLGPTHEEVITTMVKGEIRSYKELPVNLYQIQTKFRDEIRPRFGLMRGREFMMKDAYSFHSSSDDLTAEYATMASVYKRIFERCGLTFKVVEADSGSIGGDASAEFMVTAQTGEDVIIECDSCDYAANVEAAMVAAPDSQLNHESPSLELVETKDQKTIEDVSKFLKLSPEETVKTLVYNSEEGPFIVIIRGDYEVNEFKLVKQLDRHHIEMATDDLFKSITGVTPGSAGPVGLATSVPVFADYSLKTLSSSVVGANKEGHHFLNATIGRDYEVAGFFDLRNAQPNDQCIRCGDGHYQHIRGIEVGHIFQLGTKYSSSMGAHFLDENGKSEPFIMGCYGIGIGRTVAAAIEQHHDDKGIVWPKELAPFQITVIVANAKNSDQLNGASGVYQDLLAAGVDVLLDDRECSIGVKFKDAELMGIPLQVVIGKYFIESGEVELKFRDGQDPEKVPVGQIAKIVQGRLA